MAYPSKRENPILSKPGCRHYAIRTLAYLALEANKKQENKNGQSLIIRRVTWVKALEEGLIFLPDDGEDEKLW